MDYVRNAWYVAGWASDFGDDLKPVTILGESLVMYRMSCGEVVALEDECPHRRLHLSMGKRIGDAVQCGYHGMTFEATGQCVRIPGQARVPATACVRHYPVVQRHDIVFVWMGEAGQADQSRLFDLPQLSAPGWQAHQGDALHINANYLNVAENLVDPAHVSFVHPTTLGNASSEEVPVQLDTDGEVLLAWRWIRDTPPVGFFKAFGGFSGHVDRWHYYYLHLPCTAVIDFGSAATDQCLQAADRDQGVRIFALHFLTPVNEHLTIDRWMHVRNAAVGDEAASQQMDALFRVAFDEDKTILEAIEQREAQPQRRRPVRLGIDKGPVVYRERIGKLVEQEAKAKPGDVA